MRWGSSEVRQVEGKRSHLDHTLLITLWIQKQYERYFKLNRECSCMPLSSSLKQLYLFPGSCSYPPQMQWDTRKSHVSLQKWRQLLCAFPDKNHSFANGSKTLHKPNRKYFEEMKHSDIDFPQPFLYSKIKYCVGEFLFSPRLFTFSKKYKTKRGGTAKHYSPFFSIPAFMSSLAPLHYLRIIPKGNTIKQINQKS